MTDVQATDQEQFEAMLAALQRRDQQVRERWAAENSGEAIARSINELVEAAEAERSLAIHAQHKAAATLLPNERALVFRDLPPKPARIRVSPDALFAILNADGKPLATVSTAFDCWVLTGCGLPLVIDSRYAAGCSWRVEDAEGNVID